METIPYKGYSIHVNPRLVAYVWVTKDGRHVCSNSSVEGAKRQIDALAPNRPAPYFPGKRQDGSGMY